MQILKNKMPKKVASSLSLSVSAWLGSIPITIFYFKQLSIYSVLVNIIVIPFVGVLFSVLIASLIIAIVPIFSSPILKIPSLLIKCLNFIVNGVGALETSSLEFSIAYPILVFGILTLLFASDYAFIKRKMLYTAVLVFGFLGCIVIYNF